MERVVAFDNLGRIHPTDGNPELPRPGDKLLIGVCALGEVVEVSGDGSILWFTAAPLSVHPTFRPAEQVR